MIYVDTSVALALLLAESRRPSDNLWHESLVSSRLLTYELWTRLHVYDIQEVHRDTARLLIGRVSLIEMTPAALDWIVDSIPIDVNLRTLDAIHIATCVYLRNAGQEISLASYDLRMSAAATSLNIPLFDS
ncbi:MAG: PIN domain-containing protein [Gammaproteobacteria bacterium]|nr:PIN domain-containing protein [Gammaproteobacteria bacterium]